MANHAHYALNRYGSYAEDVDQADSQLHLLDATSPDTNERVGFTHNTATYRSVQARSSPR